MPDLWKALGDVYGDARHAPRSTVLDDDMAATVSAALVAPQPAPEPVAQPAPVVAPVVAPAPAVAVEAGGHAQEQVASWLADIETRRRIREQGPDLDAVTADIRRWQRGDDDVLPAGRAPKGRKGRRRAA